MKKFFGLLVIVFFALSVNAQSVVLSDGRTININFDKLDSLALSKISASVEVTGRDQFYNINEVPVQNGITVGFSCFKSKDGITIVWSWLTVDGKVAPGEKLKNQPEFVETAYRLYRNLKILSQKWEVIIDGKTIQRKGPFPEDLK